MQFSRCWLCERSETPDAKLFHSFAVKNAPKVDARSMASAFHQVLCERADGERRVGGARGYRRMESGDERPSVRFEKQTARERDEDGTPGHEDCSRDSGERILDYDFLDGGDKDLDGGDKDLDGGDKDLDGGCGDDRSLDGVCGGDRNMDGGCCGDRNTDGGGGGDKGLDDASDDSWGLEGESQDNEVDEIPSVDEIYAHLSLHILHPSVRIAHALRGLVELSETLKDLMVTKGGEDENPLVDVRAVTMYLKVTAEIMHVYRSADPSRMLFGG